MPDGRLLVLEGPEGVGKTTQLTALATWMRDRALSVAVVREPGGTPLGETIRTLLLDPARDLHPSTEALLFMASRAELVAGTIRPALARGDTVLADRFFLSTYAYQICARGLAEDHVRAANALATGGLVPDLTILLELPPGQGLARAGARAIVRGQVDRMERAGELFHARVHRAFATFANASWQRAHPECGPVVPVSGAGTVTEVRERIVRELVTRWPAAYAIP
jgi:dTMP kinase